MEYRVLSILFVLTTAAVAVAVFVPRFLAR
jgi:hypothetical protein